MAEEVNAIAKIAIDRVQSVAAEKHLAVQAERFKKAGFSDEEAKEMAKELMYDFELEIVD